MYYLKNASKDDINMLIDFKLDTIFESDQNNTIDEFEKDRIITYVKNNTNKYLDEYKLIMIDNIIVGAFLIYNYEDGVLLDEIYLLDNYRGKGIGKSILLDIIKENSKIYLWVYKNNSRALSLYKNLHFKIIEETESRYKMINDNT